jgi:16S rRNA (uracil1498-N3)-methyltransferase
MHIFYSPNINQDNLYLEEEESKHAVKVLRLKEGDPVIIVDGKGGFYNAKINDTNSKKCLLELISFTPNYGKRNFLVHIAISPTKNIDRIEWFVEKAVEIGVDKISFIQCQRSERKNLNKERMEKIAVSAMKQSQKAYLPEITELIPFKKFISTVTEKQKFIGHLEEGDKKELQHTAQPNNDYCILVGPEGDFSPEEIEVAKSSHFIPVSLGNSRLRTETAGIVSCHILNLINS